MSKLNKGFTLIELLVVVGIIAILAIAALIAINPLEAQRRGRDSARLQDMTRLQAAVEAYMNDQGTEDVVTADNVTSSGVDGRSQPCASGSNWLGLDLCDYLRAQVPLDPLNGRQGSFINAPGDTPPGRADTDAAYGFAYEATTGNISFCTRLEANSSADTLLGDIDGDDIFESGGVTDCDPTP